MGVCTIVPLLDVSWSIDGVKDPFVTMPAKVATAGGVWIETSSRSSERRWWEWSGERELSVSLASCEQVKQESKDEDLILDGCSEEPRVEAFSSVSLLESLAIVFCELVKLEIGVAEA